MTSESSGILNSSAVISKPDWPDEISIEAFRRTWQLEGIPVWETVFEMHQDKMQIKNLLHQTLALMR